MGSSLIIDLSSSFPMLLGEVLFLSNAVQFVWLGLQVALGLGFVIFVHELGHFLAAKTFGVRCDKFYVGFDVPMSIGPLRLPRTLGKFQWGETEYGIGIIPLGGYVKMLGQDDDPRKAEEEAQRIKLGEGENAPLDPRSFPAKAVWQRMIIISAGVIMNLIFAVIMAAIAFGFGVPFTPTVVGSAPAGSPAWIAGLQPGDQIVRVGDMTEDSPQLRFEDFSLNVIMRGMESKGASVPLTALRDSERMDLEITPSNRLSGDKKIFLVGIRPASVAQLGGKAALLSTTSLATKGVDLKPNDKIVAINGEALAIDPRFGQVLGSTLTSRLQADWDKAVSIRAERQEKEKTTSVEVQLPPVPVKTLGFGFKAGKITAIRKNSTAEKSGLKVGDSIESFNGQLVADALQLPSMAANVIGQTIELQVSRSKAASTEGDSASDEREQRSVSIKSQGPIAFDAISEESGQLALPGLGIALDVLPIVSSVHTVAQGEQLGVQIGDELQQVRWEPTNAEREELEKSWSSAALKSREINGAYTVASLFSEWQQLPKDLKIRCYFRRDGKPHEVVLPLVEATGWFWHQRGLALQPLQQIHQTNDIGTAFSLGLAETKKRLFEVLRFLKILVTGNASRKGVGGPIAIFAAAGSEASQGPARLLLFLTMLSANLAILNFLPVPALDGGHMVFLTAEAVRGKPVNEALQMKLTLAGVLCLLGLMAFVFVNDIFNLAEMLM